MRSKSNVNVLSCLLHKTETLKAVANYSSGPEVVCSCYGIANLNVNSWM